MTEPHDAEELTLGAAGGDEVVVVPWPALLRRRLRERVGRSPRYRWVVLATVLSGLASVSITFTILAVALPGIADDFGTTTNTMTWVITGPMLAFGVAAPAFGKAGDVWGHKRMYVLGMAGAVVCAALSAVAWDAPSLIFFRTLGGLEGAATGAASMALIFRVFERDDRVKAMGWWSLVGAGAPVIGVVLGGFVIEHLSWRWIFAAQVPLTALALVLGVALLPETARTTRRRLDVQGAVALATATTGLLFALNRGPEWGWSSAAVLIGFVLAPLGLLAFVSAERRAEEPILPLDYLRRPNFAFAIGAQAFSNFAYLGGFILAPLLLIEVFGYRESQIGLLVIARPIAFSVTAPVAGYVAVRVGERVTAVAGTAAVAASMLVFASVSGDSGFALVLVALVLSGVGLGVSSPSLAASVGNAVDEESLGIASAAQQVVTQIGVVAGIQVMATVQAAGEPTRGLVESFGDAYLLGAAVAVLGVACAFFVRPHERAARAGRQMPPKAAAMAADERTTR